MALATPEDVIALLEEDPTEGMLRLIDGYLDVVSDAAVYVSRDWLEPEVPGPVRRIVATALARFVRNPDRFQQSRAGDEMVTWQESDIEWFTPAEIERLARYAKVRKAPAFGSIQMSAHGTRPPRADVDVPTLPVPGRFPFLDPGSLRDRW